MVFTSEQQMAFDELLEHYGIKLADTSYFALLDEWVGFSKGGHKTPTQIASDTYALDTARLILQLRNCQTGVFSVEVKSRKESYCNTSVVGDLIPQLETMLSRYVEKFDGFMYLSKGTAGGGSYGRCFKIDCKTCKEDDSTGFSNEELEAIVKYETHQQKTFIKKMKGYKQKDKGNPDKENTWLPELGCSASFILNYLPKSIPKLKQYGFIFDFLMTSGQLEYRTDKDSMLNFGSRQKKEYVRNWIKSYNQTGFDLIGH